MELYEHQKRILDLNPKKFLIAHEMGTGKTITSLALAKRNNLFALIVVPKPVRKKWHIAMVNMGVDGRVMSREEFRKLAPTLDGSKFQCLIVDESHYGFSNTKSLLHKKTAWFIKRWNIEYIWLLTGTPYTSTPWAIYGQAALLGYNWDWHSFRSKFFYEQWFGSRSTWLPRPDMQGELAECVRRIGSIVRL